MASACADDSDICAVVGEVTGSLRTTEGACFFTRAFFCGGVLGGGGSSVAANIYYYNVDANGNGYGDVWNHGTPDVYGTVLAWDVQLNGNPAVHWVNGAPVPQSINYYGYDGSWREVNPR